MPEGSISVISPLQVQPDELPALPPDYSGWSESVSTSLAGLVGNLLTVDEAETLQSNAPGGLFETSTISFALWPSSRAEGAAGADRRGMRERILGWVLALGLAAGTAAAQETPGGTEGVALPGGVNRVEEFLAGGGGAEVLAPGEAELLHLDEEGRAALVESLAAYYRYRTSGFEHRRAVFDWQLLSSKIIFGVAILLVAVGVYFSWLQFMASGQAGRPAEPAAKAGAPKAEAAEAAQAAEGERTGGRLRDLASSFKGPGSFEVSSPVLGVVILVISLALFYLYLVHVYPVTELF